MLASGFSSLVVEIDGANVFRVGRNAAAVPGYRKEVRLLPELRQWLVTPVPDPRWYAAPCDEFPYGVIGYPKLEGAPLTPERLARGDENGLARGTAAFLAELHRFAPERAAELGVPGPSARRTELETLRTEELPMLRQFLTPDECRRVSRWWDLFLADPELQGVTPRVLHGDLWYENVLVDGAARSVVGVVDFENASIGDPAQDFATLLHLGEPFMQRVVAAYPQMGAPLGDAFAHRVRRYWELREFGGVRFAAQHAPTELVDAIRKLREGPVLGA